MSERIQPCIMPELPLNDLELLNKQSLIQQVAAAIQEKGVEFGVPMIAEVMIRKEGKHAGTALIFPLDNGCNIEVTRYWWNQVSIFIVGRKGRDVMASSMPILNEEIDKPESPIIKDEVDYVLDDLLSRLK